MRLLLLISVIVLTLAQSDQVSRGDNIGCTTPCADPGGWCDNTTGTPTCICEQGYTGNGLTCSKYCAGCWNVSASGIVSLAYFLPTWFTTNETNSATTCALSHTVCDPVCEGLAREQQNPCYNAWYSWLQTQTDSTSLKYVVGLKELNTTFLCLPSPQLMTSDHSCGCFNGLMDTFETDVDCGGAQCTACANGKGCALDTDCIGGTCTSGKCGNPPKAADWRKSLEAFAAIVSVVLAAVGVLLYFLWWKNISISSGATSGSVKKDLEMNQLSSGAAKGPTVEEPKEATTSGGGESSEPAKLEAPDVAPTEEVHKEGESEEVYVS